MCYCTPMEFVTSTPVAAAPSQTEFFRLPARGGDPVFGLSRSFYYSAEKAGLLKMTRLRKQGNIRGAVLVSVRAVRDYIATHAN